MTWECPDPECARPAEATCPGCASANARLREALTSVRSWLLDNAPWPTKQGRLAEVPLVEINAALSDTAVALSLARSGWAALRAARNEEVDEFTQRLLDPAPELPVDLHDADEARREGGDHA